MFSQPILAACNLETETVIKTPDQHCLLPGDTVSLNGVRSQVFKAGPDYFVVSGDVKGQAGDCYKVLDLCPEVEDDQSDVLSSDEPQKSYDWDSELLWFTKYFAYQEKKKRLTYQGNRGNEKRFMASIIASLIDSL